VPKSRLSIIKKKEYGRLLAEYKFFPIPQNPIKLRGTELTYTSF
jgi:hypothetical protein